MRIAALLLVGSLAAACSGDEVDETNKCSKAVYDKCTSEHDCGSLDCRVFGGELTCTQACSSSNPCPDLNGEPVACNAGGICEPPGPRDCDL